MITCPHCLYPLAARSTPMPDDAPGVLVVCGTCRAVLTVTVTTYQPPSDAWASNPGRRTNRSSAAMTACRKCGEVVSVDQMQAQKHTCPYMKPVPVPTVQNES